MIVPNKSKYLDRHNKYLMEYMPGDIKSAHALIKRLRELVHPSMALAAGEDDYYKIGTESCPPFGLS